MTVSDAVEATDGAGSNHAAPTPALEAFWAARQPLQSSEVVVQDDQEQVEFPLALVSE